MTYYCNPLNLPYNYQFKERDGEVVAVREAADPSLVLFKGRYYLFPSVAGGFFTSDDLLEWEFHSFGPTMPRYDYAPDVCVVGDYLYFSASNRSQANPFYRTKNPIEADWEKIEGAFPFWDPHLFHDDDGKIYLYWGSSNVAPIYGTELDRKTMRPIGKAMELIRAQEDRLGFERTGEDHVPPRFRDMIQDVIAEAQRNLPDMANISELPLEEREALIQFASSAPYVEGAWMTKYEGKYYLQYAVPATQDNIYGDAVYVGALPLGAFSLAENNPFSYKPGGFIVGAGHGATLLDKEGGWWHIATMRLSVNHPYERRIGLWRAGFDADGELFCDQRYGDWPHAVGAHPWQRPEWMLLSYGKAVNVSSGHGQEEVTSEDIRGWWQADADDAHPQVEVDLGKEYDVRAIQINFADSGVVVDMPVDSLYYGDVAHRWAIDQELRYTRWFLEGSRDGESYFCIRDKRQADTDLPHDLVVEATGLPCRFIRLTITEVPFGNPCISGLRIFGIDAGALPGVPIPTVEWLGPLDLLLSWAGTDALGYTVLWGHHPDKLYHSYTVMGKTEQRIGAFVEGQPVYLRVDAFNESGISQGETKRIR